MMIGVILFVSPEERGKEERGKDGRGLAFQKDKRRGERMRRERRMATHVRLGSKCLVLSKWLREFGPLNPSGRKGESTHGFEKRYVIHSISWESH